MGNELSKREEGYPRFRLDLRGCLKLALSLKDVVNSRSPRTVPSKPLPKGPDSTNMLVEGGCLTTSFAQAQ